MRFQRADCFTCLGFSSLSNGRYPYRAPQDYAFASFRQHHSSPFDSAEKFRVQNILTPPGSVNQMQAPEEDGQMGKEYEI